MQSENQAKNPHAWCPLENPALGVLDSLSQLLSGIERHMPNGLTNLRLGNRLVLASDYAGPHLQNHLTAYSFLLTNGDFLWLWLELRERFRQAHMSDLRRMSYKKLNDRARWEALVPFLRMANCVPGILLTVLIDHQVTHLCGLQPSDVFQSGILGEAWKPTTIEKALRVGALGGLLLAGMSAPGQDLWWFSDEDEIASNPQRLVEMTNLLARVVSNLVSHQLGKVKFGTTMSDDGSRSLEDLVSIPDLAAGTFLEIGDLLLQSEDSAFAGFDEREIPAKTETIMNWIADRTEHPLKKVCAVVGRKGTQVATRCIHFTGLAQRPEFFWHEEALSVLSGSQRENLRP